MNNCNKVEVKKCINECCKVVDVELIKNFLGILTNISDEFAYLYEIIIKNNTNCEVKNVSLIDTFLIENSIMTTTTFQSSTINPKNISLLSNTSTLRMEGNITDPCNTCLPPCSVSRIYIATLPSYLIGRYVPNNIITLHGYIGDKCIKICCNNCNNNNIKPICNTNVELVRYDPREL